MPQSHCRADTNQYDSSRMQLWPVRTDTAWNGPVRFNIDRNYVSSWLSVKSHERAVAQVRFNRDELLATKCRAHPCLVASRFCPSNYHHLRPILVLCYIILKITLLSFDVNLIKCIQLEFCYDIFKRSNLY